LTSSKHTAAAEAAARHSSYTVSARNGCSPHDTASYSPATGGWLEVANVNTAPPKTPAAVLAAAAATAQDAAAALAAGVGPASAASRLKAVRMQQAAAGASRLQQLVGAGFE
jgi:hypothetical protein